MKFTLIALAPALAVAHIAAIPGSPLAERDLQPRQTDSLPDISKECQTALQDAYGSVPSPPPAIQSAARDTDDPCSISLADSLTSSYAAYTSKVVSWYSKNADDISSALSKCPELSSYAGRLPVCSTALPDAAKATNTDDSGSAASTTSDDAAPRETGRTLAAVAALGIVIAAL